MTRARFSHVGLLGLLTGAVVSIGCRGETAAPSPGAAPPQAAAAGWFVVSPDAGAERLEVYPAGPIAGDPALRIDGAMVIGPLAGAGILYGIAPDALGYAELGMIREGDAARVILGVEPGHRYAPVVDAATGARRLVGDRLLVTDADATGDLRIRSFDRAGGTPRTLTGGGCAAILGAVVRAAGVAFRCDPGSVWFSDGASAAVPLDTGIGGAIPLELATVGDRLHVLLRSAASRLLTVPADGGGTPAPLSPEPSGTDALLATAAGAALVTTDLGADGHATYVVAADAGRPARRVGGSGPVTAGAPPVTPDGQAFLVVYGTDETALAHAALEPADPADGASIQLPAAAAGAAVLSATQFDDGTILLQLDGVGYATVSAAGVPGLLIEGASADLHRRDTGRWAVFQGSTAPFPLKAVREDGAEIFALTPAGSAARPPLVSRAGRIVFLDGGGSTWLAVPDLSLLALVDAGPSDAFLLAGGSSTTELVAVRHLSGGHATFLVHVDTGEVEEVLGGSTGGVAWFLP